MKKTILILAVLFVSVSNSFAQTTAHPNISWTGGYGWMTVDAEQFNNYYESKNVQLNINSNLGALELYGYMNRGSSIGQPWVYIECYDFSASYYEDFYLAPSDSFNSIQIRRLFQNWNSPRYFGTLYVNMTASGGGVGQNYTDAEGRLYVNWAAM